jgi:hypothetical protein
MPDAPDVTSNGQDQHLRSWSTTSVPVADRDTRFVAVV